MANSQSQTTENNGEGQPTGRGSSRLSNVKKRLNRENMERGYYSLADHAWLGMGDVWWAICHPHKAISRNIGQLSMLVVVISAFGAAGYLLFGEPNSAKLSLEEPGSILKVAGDQVLRPVGRWLKGVGTDTVNSIKPEEGFNAEDFRNGNDPSERE